MSKPVVRMLPNKGDATRAIVWVPVRGDLGVERRVQVSDCAITCGANIAEELARQVNKAIQEVQREINLGCYAEAA